MGKASKTHPLVKIHVYPSFSVLGNSDTSAAPRRRRWLCCERKRQISGFAPGFILPDSRSCCPCIIPGGITCACDPSSQTSDLIDLVDKSSWTAHSSHGSSLKPLVHTVITSSLANVRWHRGCIVPHLRARGCIGPSRKALALLFAVVFMVKYC